jgi:exodeoxyribonuclease VII large subunit
MNINLFETKDKIYSVSEITVNIKRLIESKFPSVIVEGEISNYKRQSSGHIYFTLKDDGAQLSAVIWKSVASNLKTEFCDGVKVIAKGSITLYEPSGRYQIVISSMHLLGVGELQIAFENLKNKLSKEGLFDEKHKKEIPPFPKKIGVVTSLTGAAIRDIVSVINRRYPIAEVIIFPTAVQGPGASGEIAEAIRNFNEYGKVDVIIVGRGGGSLEDLWAFNEEIVARAIFNSKIPIISAVGHHIDYTISDFVADLRAPTPSVAGELVVPDKRELIEDMKNQINSLYWCIDNMIKDKKEHIYNLLKNYAFNQPIDILLRYRQKIDEYINVIETNNLHKVELYKQSVESLNKRLQSVNPKSILKRGYCLVEKDKKIISQSKELKQNDDVKIVFHDNSRQAKILDK